MTLTKTRPTPVGKSTTVDAIALLKADHTAVEQLFADISQTRAPATKKALLAELCTLLTVHMAIEEDIFYPAVRTALNDKALVPEAVVEHAGVRDLIAQLQDGEPDGEVFNAKVKVLSEYVAHHVKEEHQEMFPKAKASSIDLVALGAEMAARQQVLTAKLASVKPVAP
jgi:iron-sulfur cluster repair protein YtfE (RIC family)